MKRRCLLFLLVITLLVSLGACASLIDGYELVYRPHEIDPTFGQDDAEYLIVSTREELTRAIWHMVEGHEESRLFRVLHVDRDTVVEEVIRDISLRPLVAYAVYAITPTILTERQGLLEMELSISYRRTAEQIASVWQVHTHLGAAARVGQMLREGETYLALLCPVDIANVGFLENIIRAYYYENPLGTVILPEPVISLYPSSGSGNLRIAVIELEFGVDHESFLQMRRELQTAAEAVIAEMPEDLTIPGQVIWLSYTLSERIERVYDEAVFSVSNTAYGALSMHSASSEGISRGLQALLSLLDIESVIIQGELDEVRHVWNLVYLDGYYYHIDISMLSALGAQDALFVPDEVMFGHFYSWDLSEHSRAESVLRYADFAQ